MRCCEILLRKSPANPDSRTRLTILNICPEIGGHYTGQAKAA